MFQPTDKIAIIGTSGCGKTILSRKIQTAWPRQVIIDPMSEFNDGEVVNSFSAFAAKMREFKQKDVQKFRLIFRFDPEIEDDDGAIFNSVLRVCYAFKKIQVIIEEVQLLTSTHTLPQYLKNCLFRGRHQGLSLIFVTQRPGALNKNILSQCQHVFCGQLHEKNDVDYLSSFLRENSENLLNMEKGKFVYFSPGNPIAIVDNGFKK